MNFLFTTVLVLLLVAPGLAFFRAYYSGKFSIRYSRLTITDQVFRSVVPGITAQMIAFWAINSLSGYSVRLDILGVLLLGAKEDKTIQEGFKLFSKDLGLIIVYHSLMIALGALLGWGIRELVRLKKWDRRFSWLRYDNNWHYLLSGEALETPDFRGIIKLKDARHIDFVFVDVLVKMEKSNMLYSGILIDYQLANDGGLKSIYLRGTHRKNLNIKMQGESDEITDDNPYYEVAGHLLVIPYEQILNLNFTYWIDDKDALTEGDQPGSAAEQVQITGQIKT